MSKSSENPILQIIDTQMKELGKSLDFRPISLERGNYVSGSTSFGSLAIDLVTGGGCPTGRWTTVYGPEGSGKSTTTLNVISANLADGVPTFYYDHEAAADPTYMRTLGIKLTDDKGKPNPYFRYFQPETGESSYRHIYRMLKALPDFSPTKDGSRPKPVLSVIIDSLDAMLTEKIADDDENAQMGLQAKMHGAGMRLVKSIMGRKNVQVLSTNQTRLKPGVSFGNPEYEPGGQAVRFYPDLKFRVQMVGKILKERHRDLKFVNVSTIKNKSFVPFRTLHVDVDTAPALAFGLGWERGYDGMAYLRLTDQVIELKDPKGFLELNVKGFEEGTRYKRPDLMRVLCSNKFRAAARAQMLDGYAFERYFDHEQIEPHPTDLEDAGLDDAKEEISVEEAESLIEKNINESLPKKKRGPMTIDPDGPIRMRNSDVSEDGEVTGTVTTRA